MAIRKIVSRSIGTDVIAAEDLAANSVTVAEIQDGAVTYAKLASDAHPTPTQVSDQPNTSTGGFSFPAGTTAQRPGSPDTGESRMNTTTGSLEFYDGANWVATNLIPTIDSVAGNIIDAYASTITLTLTNATDSVTVRFKHSGTDYDVENVDTTGVSITADTPSGLTSAVSSGDTVVVSILNQDGTPSSNSPSKTVISAPSGGTIATSGSYRYHTFTSTGTFTNTYLTSAEYLIVAGGGGSSSTGPTGTYPQAWSGGGGAGGLLNGTKTGLTISNYTATVGGGGGLDSQGGNSSVFSLTAIGGGNGAYYSQAGGSGGSGGGGGGDTTTSGGSGTAGQGNNGGAGYDPTPEGGGGGGGAGGVGAEGRDGGTGNGGAGLNYSTWATATSTGDNGSYASGGGGGPGTVNTTQTADIDGGGGRGSGGWYGGGSNTAENGAANTGGGAGGGNKTGGSGIVIIRYAI